MTKAQKNPGLYRRMSEPHDSFDAAQAALDAFHEEVRAARERHRIPDVVLVCQVNYGSGADETSAMSVGHIGDSAKTLPMLAYAFGAAERDHKQLIDAMRSRK